MVAGGLVVEPLHVAGGFGVESLLVAGGLGVEPLLAAGGFGVKPHLTIGCSVTPCCRELWCGSFPSKVSMYGQILPFKL